MRSPERLSSMNSWVCTSTGSLVFHVMIPRRLWRVHVALRCLLRLGGARLFVSATVVIGTPSTLSISSSSALTGGGGSLGPTGRSSVLKPEWLSDCELGRPFSHVVFFFFCSDATLSRYCVQCTTASFEELKEASRFS